MESILFIGLGHMGCPMAKNLIQAGYCVNVYDIDVSAIKKLTEAGAKPVHSVVEVSKKSDVIITMLQTGDQVSKLCLGENGVFANVRPTTLFIDCSSIDIEVTRKLHQLAADAGIAMLDAPVSGGVAGAEAASLTFMVGGEEKEYARAKPLLEKMGKNIIHAGKAGNGQAAKICNNLILGATMVAVSEGFTLAQKLGLDPKTFFDITSHASAQCWSITQYCPVPDVLESVPSSHDYQPGFMAKMMLKDLTLGMHAAESVSASVVLSKVAFDLYDTFVQKGHGEVDFSGIIQMIADAK